MKQVLILWQIIIFLYFNKKNDNQSPKHTPTLNNSDPILANPKHHLPHQGIEPGPHHTVAHSLIH